MQVNTIRQKSGDLASPIKGAIAGLFFGTNPSFGTGEPPVSSRYGNNRLLAPARYMLTELPNLYFADFFCMYSTHYVTLVMTRPDSGADKFCREKLVKVDPKKNPFLCIDSQDKVTVSKVVWVEILYTQNVNVRKIRHEGGAVREVEFDAERGGSRYIPKNSGCEICNLYPTA